jgi:50S ribosomal protein L16 3-hydroxylase
MLQQVLETEQFSNWTAQFLSLGGEKQDLDEQDMQNFSHQEIEDKLKAGVQFIRCPGVKAVFVEQPLTNIQDFTFYLQGDPYSVPLEDKYVVIDFLSRPIFHLEDTKLDQSSMFFTQLVTIIVNTGYWYPD